VFAVDGTGRFYPNALTEHILFIQVFDGGLSLYHPGHFNKTEAFALTGIFIHNQIAGFDFTERLEQLSEFILSESTR